MSNNQSQTARMATPSVLSLDTNNSVESVKSILFSRSYKFFVIGLTLFVLLLVTPTVVRILKSFTSRYNSKVVHSQSHSLASYNQSADKQSVFEYKALGITAPLIASHNINPLDLRDWAPLKENLKHGVGIIPDHTSFGQAKTLYIIGHSSDMRPWNPYSSIFAGLGQAQEGDVFQLTLEGKKYDYTVVKKTAIQPTDIQAFETLRLHDNKQQRVILVTCWPVFTTNKRLIVVGERRL